MASKAISLSVRPRGKPTNKLPEEVSLPSASTTSDLYETIAREVSTSVRRLRITKGSDGSVIPNAASRSIHETGLRDQSTIYVKDLGPQLAWRTVFLFEYLGPLLIHPLFYILLRLADAKPAPLQTLTFGLVMAHFAKRELETLFVHRFSPATMPAINLIKNSAYYWALAGVNLAFWTYRPGSPTARPANPYITYPALALFLVGELGNLYTHLVLRGLRRTGTAERGIPQGWGFGLVTCPNYTFEALAWVGIALVAWNWSAVLFLGAALLPMGVWGRKKEAKYRREFGASYSRKKYVFLPGIW